MKNTCYHIFKKTKQPNVTKYHLNHKQLKQTLIRNNMNHYNKNLLNTKKKCNDLQTENMELILTLNKFLTAHQSWDYETVCEWIITIENGMFQPYKDILLTNLESE
eukprot:824287_1